MARRPSPSLDDYLLALPGGIDAYPQCLAKASVVRDAMTLALPDDLEIPAALRAMLDAPPPVTAWVPEVHQNALMLGILDSHFGSSPDGLERFYAWVLERNRRLFSSTLYRALFFVLSPERLLGGFERRWSTFRRGTTLALDERTPTSARARLISPPHLHSRLSLRGLGIGFQAALEGAGATEVEVSIPFVTPTDAIYSLRWR